MAETRTLQTPWRTVTSNEASSPYNGFTPVSDWFEIAGLEDARCGYEVRNLTGLLELIPAIQLADHPRDSSPTTTNLGTTWVDADGFHEATTFTDVETTANANQVARLGFVTRNSDLETLSSCEVQGTWDLVSKRRLPDVVMDWDPCIATSTTGVFFPVTAWMDYLPTRRLRGVVELRGKTGDFQVYIGVQVTDDVDNPATTFSIGSSPAADGIYFPTVWSSPSSSPNRKIRFGWWVRLSSGSTTAFGTARGRIQRLAE